VYIFEKRNMSFSSHDSNSDSSIDDESSIDRDECDNRKCRRLVALVSRYIILNINKRRKIPSQCAGKKTRKHRDPDVLPIQESLDDGMFEQEYRMSYASFCKLFDLLGEGLFHSPRNSSDDVILPKIKLLMTI
jgi:hypothetical protein